MSTKLETLRKTPNLANKIRDILKDKFIYVDNIADILAAAIYSGQNVILFGPGGHGKSEMVEAVMEGLGLWDRNDPSNSQTLIQSFGEGLTEDVLWGGIDFRKLNCPSAPDMVFNVENSFLNYPVAVFEELFDAPAFCLLPLKHTLQAGFLAKNGKAYPMKTQLIIACTNRNPEEIADMGETYRALLERFVLRQEVVWEEYSTQAYLALFNKHKTLVMSETNRNLLAGLMNDCQEYGHTISPRTAMKAIDVLIGSAISDSRTEVLLSDFSALKHITGFQGMVSKLDQAINIKTLELEAREYLHKFTQMFGLLYNQAEQVDTKVVEYCILARQFMLMSDALRNVNVPDSLYEARTTLLDKCSRMFDVCKDRAVSKTNAELPKEPKV